MDRLLRRYDDLGVESEQEGVEPAGTGQSGPPERDRVAERAGGVDPAHIVEDHALDLVVGLAGLFCLAAGLTLTSFTRRPEYGAKPPTEDGQPTETGGRKGIAGLVLSPIEFAARIVVHYPQYIWICALADRMDLYFWAYAAVNVLYLLKTLAGIMLRLGRFSS